MRVLFHIPQLYPTGAERQFALLVKGMVAAGIEAHVMTYRPGYALWDELAELDGCSLVHLERRGFWDLQAIRSAADYVRAHAIEVIQGWLPHANTFAAVVGALTRRRVVMGVRVARWDDFSARARLHAWLNGPLGRLWCDAIVCNAEEGRRFHLRRGYPAGMMRVIPNGVAPPDGLAFPEPFARAGPVRVGMLASLHPRKAHPAALQALRMLLDAGHDLDLHLYGDGLPAPGYREQLTELARALGVAPRVQWYGHVADPWGALAGLDVLCSASTTEGMSNTILEGMAAGRVVVATAVGAAPSLLAGPHGACGFLAPPDDAAGIAVAIATALADRGRALAYARRARAIAREHYSPAAMVERYRDLYEAVLAREAGPPDA